jgi:hypothetical protein
VALTIMDASYTSLIADEMEVTSSSYQSYSTTVTAPGAGAIGAVTFYSEDTGVFDACCTVVED